MQERSDLRRSGVSRLIWVGLWVGMFGATVQGQSSGRSEQPYIDGSISSSGINLFMADRWALVKARVSNPTDSARYCRVVWSFANEPSRQFVRRVWVPAHAIREVSWPARLGEMPASVQSAQGTALLLADDAEVSYGDEPGTVVVAEMEAATSILADENESAIDALVEIRQSLGLGKSVNYPPAMELGGPRYTLGWHAIESLVLASPSLTLDAAQRRAMRRWLRAGGTLWVMLDQVDEQLIEQMLGDDWAVQLVDRTSWNQVQIDPGPDGGESDQASADAKADAAAESETPFEVVRVLAPDYSVILESQGWPVLLSRRVGAGRIMITTINARAWTGGNNVAAMQVIGQTLYPAQAPASWDAMQQATDEFVQAQIGYRIIGRGPVAVVLGGYLLLFTIGGIVMLLRRRAVQLAMIGLASAAAAGGVLLAIGYAQRGSEEPTVATLQVVRVQSGSVASSVTGTMAMFTPFERQATLDSQRGGMAWPRDRFSSGATRRLMWRDLDQWQWQRLVLSGGAIAKIDYATSGAFARPPTLSAEFGSEGLKARASVPTDEPLFDAVVIHGDKVIAARAGPDGELLLGSEPLPRGQYIDAAVMNRSQQSRQSILQALHKLQQQSGPMLVGWSALVDDGLSVDADMQRRGEALWLVPMEFTPARSGQSVVVNRAWVSMQPVRRLPGLVGVATLYDPRKGEFIPMSLPGIFGARFTWPSAVAPLKLNRARLFIDIDAPQRPVEILAVTDGQAVVIKSFENVTGPIEIDLDPAQLGATGRDVLIGIRVGAAAGASSVDSPMWQMRQLGLEVSGVVGQRDETAR